MQYLETLNPLDGRYKKQVSELVNIFSEKALFEYRCIVEIKYLINILSIKKINKQGLTLKDKNKVISIATISDSDYKIIKKIELEGYKDIKATNHDVKALEYFIRLKLKKYKLSSYIPYVHFALTSEDINNIAYSLMIRDGLEKVLINNLENIADTLKNLSLRYRNVPVLARTHGQPASPTTFGKEFKVFESRLNKKIKKIKKIVLESKINGATGNYNAHYQAFPSIDWIKFSNKFINSFNKGYLIKIKSNLITTQIESHDSYVELFDLIKQTNSILINLSQDIWRYISDNWLSQKTKDGEIGSSTMPHKVNPIDFENAEGNLGLASSLLSFFSLKLPISRLQRDLSDSTVLRNIGVSFGYCTIAYKSIIKGLDEIEINKKESAKALNDNYQVITEGVQIILKREGIEDSYEKLLSLSRGKEFTRENLEKLLNTLNISKKTKNEILSLSPEKYTGLASKIVGLKIDN